MKISEIVELTRHLRKNQTPAEKAFWKMVRKKKILSRRIFRQYPIMIRDQIGKEMKFFILDFYCRKLKLAIEIDGAVHDTQKERDEDRTYYLQCRGIKVIRFTNQEVLSEPQKVQQKLEKQITQRRKEDQRAKKASSNTETVA